MYTRDIENGEVDRTGGKRTRAANTMTKLIRGTQFEECPPGEEVTVPLLQGVVQWCRKYGGENRYLNSMERVAGVLLNNTFFTGETVEVAIQATIRGAVYAARVTRWRGGMGKAFMHHEFIGELLLVLKPLFELVLYSQ